MLPRWSRRVCKLEIEIPVFNIGPDSADCTLNNINLAGKELCGKLDDDKGKNY